MSIMLPWAATHRGVTAFSLSAKGKLPARGDPAVFGGSLGGVLGDRSFEYFWRH
jgi:hypothetical protein